MGVGVADAFLSASRDDPARRGGGPGGGLRGGLVRLRLTPSPRGWENRSEWESRSGSGCGAVGAPAATVSTGRKYSWAVVPTCCWACLLLVPLGMLTMMLLEPWVCTSASETPRPLTRRSMMLTAVSMLVLLIAFGLPGVFFAWSVMLVPPARSIPRRGVMWPDANIPPLRATTAIRNRIKVRPGLPGAPACLRPLLGAATFSFLPVQPPRAGYAPERPRSDVGTCPRRKRHGTRFTTGPGYGPGWRPWLLRACLAVGLAVLVLGRLGVGLASAGSVSLTSSAGSGFLPRSILAAWSVALGQ